jgi:hypothetical protein
VTELTERLKNAGRKVFMESIFSSPEVYEDLTKFMWYCQAKLKRNAYRFMKET